MAKAYSQFVCQQCGYSQVGWAGKCPNCGSWSSLVETILEKTLKTQRGKTSDRLSKPVKLTSVSLRKTKRVSTKIPELDRVLGGGLVEGQIVLVAGEPGVGKSTILLQLANKMGKVLYISGEESVGQISLRAKRLGVGNKKLLLMEENNIDNVIENISDEFSLIVVDSIQTMFTSDLTGMAGSVGQVRECAYRLVKIAKSKNIPIFIVGHVTKEGSVAGPAVLAHIVDTVLWFEGDKSLTVRLLRAVKNRFGPTDEIGVFSMKQKGLVSVDDLSKLFLSDLGKNVSGSVVTSVMQGTRPLLIEIQSLVMPSKMAYQRRIAQGIESRRLEMLLAVLTRRCGIFLSDQDVYVNVVGGLEIRETASDLAVALSVSSSYFDKPLPKKLLAIGEVGLLGEIREVVGQDKRIKDARRLGFNNSATNNEFKFLLQTIKKYLK